MADLMQEMGAVGNAARAPKQAGRASQLKEFSVKRGDNGGVIVCETYRSTPPEGRRYGASYPDAHDYKENPFSPDDGAAAADYVRGLMGQMGVTPPAPAVTAARGPERAAVSGPNLGAARGPNMAAVRTGPPLGGPEPY